MAKGISPAWRFAAATDGPVALFLDVDGTLLDLAERPDEVVMPAGLLATLAEAEHKVEGALALVSGRAIDDLDRLFEPLACVRAGSTARRCASTRVSQRRSRRGRSSCRLRCGPL
jgi:trehalose-phosphatase